MYKLWLYRLRFRKVVQIIVCFVLLFVVILFQLATMTDVYSLPSIGRMILSIYFVFMIHEARISLVIYSRKAKVEISSPKPITSSNDPAFNRFKQGSFPSIELSRNLRKSTVRVQTISLQTSKVESIVLQNGYKLAAFLKYYASKQLEPNVPVVCLNSVSDDLTSLEVSVLPLWYTILSNNSFGRCMYIGNEPLYDTTLLSPVDSNGRLLPLEESGCGNGIVIDIFVRHNDQLYFSNGSVPFTCFVRPADLDTSVIITVSNAIQRSVPDVEGTVKLLGIYRSAIQQGQPHISAVIESDKVPRGLDKRAGSDEATGMVFYFLKDSQNDVVL